MWAPLAAKLARDHTVIVPDLRGMGLSSQPAGGYDKKTQGATSRRARRAEDRKVDLVTHDIGNMVGYAFAAEIRGACDAFRPDRRAAAGRRAVGGDPQEPAALALPLRRPGHGAAGRRARAHLPRPLLERVLGDPASSTRHRASHYAALYAQPGAMHAGFAQFAAFDQDAIDKRSSHRPSKVLFATHPTDQSRVSADAPTDI